MFYSPEKMLIYFIKSPKKCNFAKEIDNKKIVLFLSPPYFALVFN